MGKIGVLTDIVKSGLTKAEEVAETILNFLRKGEPEKITDEMLDEADDVYLYKNYDLPMDESSRIKRADEMGASSDLYHMTEKNFSEFKKPIAEGAQGKGIYTSTSPDRSRGLRSLVDNSGEFVEGTNIMPVKFMGESFNEGKTGLALDPFSEEGIAMLKRFGLRPNKNYSEIKGAKNPDGVHEQINDILMRRASKTHKKFSPEWMEELNRLQNEFSKKAGYTSTFDDYRGYNMAFDPSNVRSKFARFDPRLSKSKNLLASAAPVAVSLGALSELKEEPQ